MAHKADRLGRGERISMDNGISSCLFTLRLWHEQLGEGQREWRGKIQYTDGGDALYFRQWGAMLEFLQETLEELAPRQEPAGDGMAQGAVGNANNDRRLR
jgi:hypothetical protein